MSTLSEKKVPIAEACAHLIQGIQSEEFADLFPKSLKSPLASWVRLDCVEGFKNLVTKLSIKPEKGSHLRKGWQSGMAVVLHVAKAKGLNLSEKQLELLQAHTQEVEVLFLLIVDTKIQRERINCVKLQRDIMVFDDLLNQTAREWLAKPWPQVKPVAQLSSTVPSASSSSSPSGFQ